MRYLIASLGAALAVAGTASPQTYTCENGELIGGETNVTARCTTNKAGQITSVTPYKVSNRQSVRIYPNNQVRSAPVKTYTPASKRTYTPAPLSAQTNRPPEAIIRPGYTVQTAPAPLNIYRSSRSVRATRPQIISAVPSSRIQTAAYAAPCSFNVRKVARTDRNQFEVCGTDINPQNRRTIKKLYKRLKTASRRACGTDYDSILSRWSKENSQCAAASLDRAVMTSGIEPLQAYHLAKTGKGTPHVSVGAPRFAN